MAVAAKKPGAEDTEVDAGDARSQTIEKAWEEHESVGEEPREGAPAGGDVTPPPELEVEGEGEGDEDQPRDEQGRFAAKGEEGEETPAGGEEGEAGGTPAGEGPAEAGAEGDQAAIAAAAAATAAAVEQPPALKAPGSWRPAERDAFLKLKGPEADVVRAAANRREAQIEGAMRENEQTRRFAEDFYRRAEPYRGLYAMLQTSPLQAFDVLMRSAAVLYQGDDHLKARTVAQMMRERGVKPELVADYLDSLAGVALPDGRPAPERDPQLAQVVQSVAEIRNELTATREAEQNRAQELANRHVEDWGKDKPWFPDVRKRMASIMKAATEDGEELTLDQAYATAISLNPEISKLEAQRVRALAIKKQQQTMAKAGRAASSPRPNPSRRPPGTPSGDRRTDIESAWDEQEGRT